MKNFSFPRLAFLLWFANYALFAMVRYILGGGRVEIFPFIVNATLFTVVELVALGFIEEKF